MAAQTNLFGGSHELRPNWIICGEHVDNFWMQQLLVIALGHYENVSPSRAPGNSVEIFRAKDKSKYSGAFRFLSGSASAEF